MGIIIIKRALCIFLVLQMRFLQNYIQQGKAVSHLYNFRFTNGGFTGFNAF